MFVSSRLKYLKKTYADLLERTKRASKAKREATKENVKAKNLARQAKKVAQLANKLSELELQ